MSIELLDFYADWCGPCKQQDPILETLEEEYDELSVTEIDVDEEQYTANKHNVRALPTLIFRTEDEDDEMTERERFVGFTDEDKLRETIEGLLQ